MKLISYLAQICAMSFVVISYVFVSRLDIFYEVHESLKINFQAMEEVLLSKKVGCYWNKLILWGLLLNSENIEF